MAQETKETVAARAAAEKWLKLVDAGDYSNAWNSSSEEVRAGTSGFFWTTVVSASRLPLGEARSRKLKAAVPGANGKQVAFEYESRFGKDQTVSETVKAAHEKDGAWRVTGYSVNAR